MPEVLICSTAEIEPALTETMLWRQEFKRRFARTLEEAHRAALAARPAIVLVDRDLPWAVDVVKAIRQDAATRSCSLAIVARGDFQAAELELLEAGANAVLRLPADAEWDKRLARLLQVTARREARVPIHLQLEATLGPEEPFTARTVNVSETGLLVQSAIPLGLGRELDFAFQLPGTSGLISGRARVARLASRGGYGLEFTDLDGEILERLRAFLREARPHG